MILQQDLTASPQTISFLGNNESAAIEGNAADVLRTTVDRYRGQLHLTATLTNAATQQNRTVFTLVAPVPGIIPMLNALANRIDPRATAFPAIDNRALQLFTRSAGVSETQSRINLLGQAIEADPRFGLAYIVMLELLERSGAADTAPVLARAEAHAASFTPIDRARLAVLRLRLSDAPLAQQAQATAALVELTPNDVDQLVALAAQRYLQNDARNADHLINRASAISPGSANVRQQYAQGLIETGRFREAEKILLESGETPAALVQSSFCVLLEGDLTRAVAIAEKFLASVQNADARTLLRGSWLAMSRDSRKGIEYLKHSSFTDAGVRSLALSEAVLWQASNGDFADARELAATVQSGGASNASVLARLLSTKPTSSALWRSEVDALPASGANATQAKELLAAYGNFLFGFYPEAIQAWQTIANKTGNADLAARAMLRASLEKGGRADDARRVLIQPFVPDLGNFYAAVPFSQLRRFLR